MAGPPNQPPGKQPANQAAPDGDDEEAKMRQQAAMLAMMDDLGIARLEELPLDDQPRSREHGRRNPGPNAPPNRPRRAGHPRVAARGNTNHQGHQMGALWTAAYALGVFNDSDAREVQGLDDLGGGRIYDSDRNGMSQREKVSHTTTQLLNQASIWPARQPSGLPAPQNAAHLNGDSAKKPALKKPLAAPSTSIRQAAASRTLNAINRTLASSSTNPAKLNPLARPVRPIRPPTSAAVVMPTPQVLVDEPAPPALDIPNVVFKAAVKFLSRDVSPALPAGVILSAASQPELGFFIVLIFGRKFCEWAISTWYDYFTGADHSLSVTFQDSAGIFQGYELYFNNNNDLREFLATVQSLRAGKHPGQAESSLTPASISANSGKDSEASGPDTLTGKAGNRNDSGNDSTTQNALPSTPPARPSARRAENPVTPTVNGNAAITAAVVQTTAPRDAMTGSTEKESSIQKTSATVQGTLIDLEADVASVATSHHPSEAAELLSTLEPYSYNSATANDETSVNVSRAAIMVTARSLFQFFLYSGVGGRTTTAAELAQTVAGIRSGVLRHIVEVARAQGLDDQKTEELKDVVNSIFDDEMRAVTPAPSAARRIQYTPEELLARRHAAIQPPSWMADIPYLPKPGGLARQSSNSSWDPQVSRQRASSDVDCGLRTEEAKHSQLSRSQNAMSWVLGKSAEPEPKQGDPKPEESSKAQTTARDVPKPFGATKPRQKETAADATAQDTGLGGSIWATDRAQIMHANSFTGPAYERIRPKPTYLEDLAQLAPETNVNESMQDLMDICFPMPSNNEAQAAAAVAPISGSHSGSANISTGDNIETVRVGFSRLSIGPGSSTLTRTQPAGSPHEAPVQSPQAMTARSPSAAPVQSPQAASVSLPSAASTQFPLTTPVQPAAAQATTQPRLRGLASSRHCQGDGPSSSGQFNYFVPDGRRK